MSYDLAVWEGVRPADDAAAGRLFRDLYDRYVDTGAEHPPSDRKRSTSGGCWSGGPI
ncbi:hypothetical protein [Streptomyces sp. Caat 7-52]|uniref:hypothetical protein n=1 Tax=Streptomyces sp. Caat 7-52 TaxID=2949637 RepID=UPI0020361FC9|nr:hypothetical protein [Streptomyces sp. Caat 7-52]